MNTSATISAELERLQGRLDALARGISQGNAQEDTVALTCRRITLQVSECAERHAKWDERLISMLEHDTRRSAEVARRQDELATRIGLRPRGEKSRLWYGLSYFVLILSLIISFVIVTPLTAIRRWYERRTSSGTNALWLNTSMSRPEHVRNRYRSQRSSEETFEHPTAPSARCDSACSERPRSANASPYNDLTTTKLPETIPGAYRGDKAPCDETALYGKANGPTSISTSVDRTSPRPSVANSPETLLGRKELRLDNHHVDSHGNMHSASATSSPSKPVIGTKQVSGGLHSLQAGPAATDQRANCYSPHSSAERSNEDENTVGKKECVALRDGRRRTREELSSKDARDKWYQSNHTERRPSWARDLTQSSSDVEIDESSRDFWNHFNTGSERQWAKD